jgi:hypothetical protein
MIEEIRKRLYSGDTYTGTQTCDLRHPKHHRTPLGGADLDPRRQAGNGPIHHLRHHPGGRVGCHQQFQHNKN